MGDTYLSAEFLHGEALHGVDAQRGVGMDDGETTSNYTKDIPVSNRALNSRHRTN